MLKLPRAVRYISRSHLFTDLALMLLAAHISLLLRLKPTEAIDYLVVLYQFLPLILATRTITMISMGCYRVMWRFVSSTDAIQLAKAVGVSAVAVILLMFFLPESISRLPRSFYVIDAGLCFILLTGVRLGRRLLFERERRSEPSPLRRTLIYGAGNNGRTLAQRFRSDPALGVEVTGFIDDDPEKQNMSIQGIPVLGSRVDLGEILRTQNIEQFILALPNLPASILREVTLVARDYNLVPKITTQLSQGSEASNRSIEILRNVELRDLLHRPARQVDSGPVRKNVHGQCVLVTGAGGSIGSEIARQVLSHSPRKLLLLDHSELALYEIDRELRTSTHDLERVVPLLGDIKDTQFIDRVMDLHQPDCVFHAAAYKHVHLVESNPGPAILNNVGGTLNLLEASLRGRVRSFVLISTDKAVNPVGVMGATKRVCELITAAYAADSGRLFSAVRFGNVLGSSGSLIPLLTRQIREGGPVTITHQDMTRFFMLIPEAVSLVLISSTLARPGDIHVLKMGDPVRIVDIAHSLMSLMGVNETQVPIVYTGLRPGEKMFEELYIRGDELATLHPDILTLPQGDNADLLQAEDRKTLYHRVGRLLECARLGHPSMLAELNSIVRSPLFNARATPSLEGKPHN